MAKRAIGLVLMYVGAMILCLTGAIADRPDYSAPDALMLLLVTLPSGLSLVALGVRCWKRPAGSAIRAPGGS